MSGILVKEVEFCAFHKMKGYFVQADAAIVVLNGVEKEQPLVNELVGKVFYLCDEHLEYIVLKSAGKMVAP